MGNAYYQDRTSPAYWGDAKDKLPLKGQPNKFSGIPVKTDAKFSAEYSNPDDTYTNERKK